MKKGSAEWSPFRLVLQMVLGLGRQHAFQLVLHGPRHAIRHRLALHHDRAICVEVDDSTLVQDELMMSLLGGETAKVSNSWTATSFPR